MKRFARVIAAGLLLAGLLAWALTKERGRAPDKGEAFGLDAKTVHGKGKDGFGRLPPSYLAAEAEGVEIRHEAQAFDLPAPEVGRASPGGIGDDGRLNSPLSQRL